MVLPPRPDNWSVARYAFFLDGYQYQFQVAVIGASWREKGKRLVMFPKDSPEYIGYNVMLIRGTLRAFINRYNYSRGVTFNGLDTD